MLNPQLSYGALCKAVLVLVKKISHSLVVARFGAPLLGAAVVAGMLTTTSTYGPGSLEKHMLYVRYKNRCRGASLPRYARKHQFWSFLRSSCTEYTTPACTNNLCNYLPF